MAVKKTKKTNIELPTWEQIISKKAIDKFSDIGISLENIASSINKALQTLNDNEQAVLKLRFGLWDGKEHTLKEIGKRFDLTAELIRQIESKALRKLMHPSRSRRLKHFFDDYQKEHEIKEKNIEKIADLKIDPHIIFISSNVYEKMISYFLTHPEEMKTMNRRLFEEMIAEVFKGFGYEVELTKQTRDGGKDIIAIKRSKVSVKYLIECKRPKTSTLIGISPVRELYAVKVDEKATKAILATTTSFTSGAKEFFDRHIWELEPRDFSGILEWIEDYFRCKQ